ncbi:MAG: hypothetical protein MUC50_09070 [Myxococcota bacterium]|jgi:hypothetical protein|nr:hypothetical protein [Myxococcota bacterium]
MSDLPTATCDDCVAFSADDPFGSSPRVGHCILRRELGDLTSDFPACELFKVRAGRSGTVTAPLVPKTSRRGGDSYRHSSRTLESPMRGDTEGFIDMDRDGLKRVLRELLEEETLYGYPRMAPRFQDGALVIQPADKSLQSKEVPIEVLFHKIVMLRDRLRVLESKINGHDRLKDSEKVELQGYISKCYGTLTTFNILFADKDDQFSSKD